MSIKFHYFDSRKFLTDADGVQKNVKPVNCLGAVGLMGCFDENHPFGCNEWLSWVDERLLGGEQELLELVSAIPQAK